MKIAINGVRLFFDVDGAGLATEGPAMRERPTLLLLHGAPGAADHSAFKPLFGALTDATQVIYLDLRGCGRSDDGPPHLLTLAQWADDIRALCDALGVEKPVLLGHSGGGFVAIQYAARHADRIGKLILSSTQARVVPERILDVMRRRGSPEAVAAAEQWLARPADPQTLPGWAKYGFPLYNHAPQDPDGPARRIVHMDTWWAFARLWYVERADLTPLMRDIACPTLILHGDDDPICPVDDARDMLSALQPGVGRLQLFERCGHGVWRDYPERGLQAIRDFVVA